MFLVKLKNKILVFKKEIIIDHDKLSTLLFKINQNVFNNIYLDKKLKNYISDLDKKIHDKKFQEKSLDDLENALTIKLNKELINYTNNKKFVESVINQLDYIKTNVKIEKIDQYELSNLFEGFINKFRLDFETVKGRFINEMTYIIISKHMEEIENVKTDYEQIYHQELMKVIHTMISQMLAYKFEYKNSHKELLIELVNCIIILHLDSITNERSETLLYHIMCDYFLNLSSQHLLMDVKKDLFLKIVYETYEKHDKNLKNQIKPIMLTYDESIKDDEKKAITDEVVKRIIMERHK